ncbi:MAG: phage head-tail connector protein [Firmicutes bacterium]|nr:phage head-tail connector protein [Bacillota bacterium]
MLNLTHQQKRFNKKWLEFFKHNLKIQGSDLDYVLQFFLASAVQSVLNYINRTKLPKELELVVIKIATEIFRNNEILLTEDETMGTESLTLAGARVGFGLSGGKRGILRGIIDDRIRRTDELNQYRSLFRLARLPKNRDKGEEEEEEDLSIGCLSARKE